MAVHTCNTVTTEPFNSRTRAALTVEFATVTEPDPGQMGPSSTNGEMVLLVSHVRDPVLGWQSVCCGSTWIAAVRGELNRK